MLLCMQNMRFFRFVVLFTFIRLCIYACARLHARACICALVFALTHACACVCEWVVYVRAQMRKA